MSKDKIKAQSLKLFARYGFGAVSMQSIADAVGLHKSSLFHHFRTKRDIAEDLLLEISQALLDDAQATLTEEISAGRLFGFVEGLVSRFADKPDWARFLAHGMLADADQSFCVTRQEVGHPIVRFFQHLGFWLERARDEGVIAHPFAPIAILQALTLLLFPATLGDLACEFGLDSEQYGARLREVGTQSIMRLLEVRDANR